MSNVLAAATKENTRFTVFENDQVLTADQLNDLFNYLDVQTRLTRTRAIGVGIICGLEIGTLENKQVIVSKGSAITTDGDLLHFNSDQLFDQYRVYEDPNAKYPYFRKEDETLLPMFELLKSKETRSSRRKDLASFEGDTNSSFGDYAGVLYLEDYDNDPALCTNEDCDNKGSEAVKELRVLLIHKSNVRLLLQSIPAINKNYFALEEFAMPRILISKSISLYSELKKAYADALAVKDEIKNKLSKAFQVCRLIADDEFDGGDPTNEWSNLIDESFKTGNTIYAQYVYDFAKDLGYAYNELRETLFGDNMMCCPNIMLFPKHVMMGLVKTASLNRNPIPIDTRIIVTSAADARGGTIASLLEMNHLAEILRPVRFDIASLIRRFHPVHIDMEYRHLFYESPVLNNKEENVLQTKFCFRRIDSMIRNFKVPVSEELRSAADGIKITPGKFEDKPLGDRSLPFYYGINRNLPANLYWSYSANIHKKEDAIYSYNAGKYSNNAAALSPLQFNILPFDFFRIEGHIGFAFPEVERALNNLIDSNNLPINLMTVQVEHRRETIPPKNWWFPQLHVYEHFVRNSFIDHMNQVDLVHANLAAQVGDQPAAEANSIKLSIDNFSNARNKVMTYSSITDNGFDVAGFKADTGNVIKAATDVKVQTKQFTFSNAATPHDFVINTDILHKADLLAGLLQQAVDKKKDGLMLGNFMAQNPGLEHAAGVLRGGTFVLVYTADDNKVVADFMLPYASVDKDIVADPPVFRPIPLPTVPKLQLPKVFEKLPPYRVYLDDKIKPFDIRFATLEEKIKPFDDRLAGFDRTIADKFNGVDKTINERLNGMGKTLDDRMQLFTDKFANIDKTVNDRLSGIDKAIDTKITQYDAVLKDKLFTTKFNAADTKAGTGVLVGGRDLTNEINAFQTKQKELDATPATAPNRAVKEQELVAAADTLTTALSQVNIADVDSANTAKALLFDVQSSTSAVKNQALATNVATISTKVTGITKNIKTSGLR